MTLGRTWKATVASLLTLASIAVLIAACGGSSSTSSGGSDSTGTESSAEPQPGGTLSVSLGEEITGLNPGAGISTIEDVNLISQIFETLFKEDYEGKVVPWLLESYKPSKNYTVWTMRLKNGVKFSNGKPMTSADVVWTLERSMETETRAALVEGWEKVEALSPTTVVIITKQPTPEMPLILTQWIFSVVPKNWEGESEKQFFDHPIGTGPFEFVDWKKGESVTLKKNPNYWVPDRPYLDEVVYRTVQDPNSRTAQVRGGQLDMAYSPPFPEIESLENSPELAVDSSALGTEWYLVLNTKSALFENRKAREAVNYGLDRESMIEVALHGHGEPMNSYLTPPTPNYDKSLRAPEQNIEKAKELLAEAVQEGVEPTFTISSIAESPFWTQAIQIAQANLEEAGFTVSIKLSDLSSMIGQLEESDFDASAIMNYGKSSAAELLSFYNGTGGSFANVDTQQLEELLPEAQSETNTAKRNAIYAQMQQMINEEQAVIPAAYSPFMFARQSDVAGSFIGNTGILWLGEAGFTG